MIIYVQKGVFLDATDPKVKIEYFPRFRGYAPLAQLDRALVYGTKG